MGLAPDIVDGAIRVSLGWNTTEEDIDRFSAVAKSVLARGRARIAA